MVIHIYDLIYRVLTLEPCYSELTHIPFKNKTRRREYMKDYMRDYMRDYREKQRRHISELKQELERLRKQLDLSKKR